MAELTDIKSLLIRGSYLTEAEKETLRSTYVAEGREAVTAFAKEKKILPFAANAFCSCGADTEYWTEILEEYRERNRLILAFLDKLYRALEAYGVRKMFVSENFGALLSAQGDIGLFSSGDIDNYADPSEKDNIYRAFEALGYERKERYSGHHQIAAEFFPPKTAGLPDGFYISVDFYPLARLKLPCFVRADDFVDWERLTFYKTTRIVLPPPDALMYICLLHISLHSFSRAPDIRLYADILNMSRTNADCSRVAEWCKKDKTVTRAAAAVYLSNRLMKTELPEDLFFASERYKKVVRLVYDDSQNDLIYEPRGLKILRIETRCCDGGILKGLSEILFPDRGWMKKVYGSSGAIAHVKHFFKVI